ncbi:serine/arginine-rich splicing factor SC35-like [Magnolia sinica]|uniref:serine/arginine-rich splicing factor SC35-like n=1 Tax=Magnolia sinica TaxID=86752 RepID=UPI002659953F|nr:serine/arginine-rich splicing factor SC35-like [Magnolia sinica]
MEERDPSWTSVDPQKLPRSPFSIFAANLSYDTSIDDLHPIFGRFGKLKDVFIPWNRNLNRSRGFTFIHFVYEQEAFNAIQCLHDRKIDGRIVHIDWSKKQSRGSSQKQNHLDPATSIPNKPPLRKYAYANGTSDAQDSDPSRSPAYRVSDPLRAPSYKEVLRSRRPVRDGPEVNMPIPPQPGREIPIPSMIQTNDHAVKRILRSLSCALITTVEEEGVSILHLIDVF